MSAEHPDLVIELSLGDERVDLVSAGVDLAVRIGELPSSSLVARRVGRYGFVCCAAPAHLAREGNAVDASRARPGPVHPEPEPGAARPLAVPRRGGRALHGRGARHARDRQRRGAAGGRPGGAGIIYAPRELVADDLAAGALVDVLPDWRTIELPIHTVHPSRTMVPRRVSAVIDALATGLREEA